MFESLPQNGRRRIAERLGALLLSALLHGLILILFIVLPLVFFRLLPGEGLLAYLIATPKFEAPVSPAPEIRIPKVPFQRPIEVDKFEEPDKIPIGVPTLEIAEPVFGPIPVSFGPGVTSGLKPSLTGIEGSHPDIVKSLPPVPPPAPPPPPKTPPVRKGGDVLESRLIKKVMPEYPRLAQAARVERMVVLEVIVDEEGNVTDVKVLKGHPLLNESAERAVRQWKYSPTLLNGEPIPIISTVTVVYRLNK